MEKQKRDPLKIWKIAGASAALLLMLPGVYFAGIRYIGSQKIAVAALIAAGLAIAAVVSISLILKQNEKRNGFLKAVLLILVIGLALVNLGTLISPYFIAHNTTTIENRYYPDSLAYMALLQKCTQDKTVWVDEGNDYLDPDSVKDTATDFSNRAAVHYACAEIKTLTPSPGELTAGQEDWLISLDVGYTEFIIKYDKGLIEDREEAAYVYAAFDASEYSDIVFLWSKSGSAYWVPMAVYNQMMGETHE